MLPFYANIDLRVELEDPNDSNIMLDMTCLGQDQMDWVDECTVNDALDNQTMTAEITLFREQEKLSISPLEITSKLNLIDALLPPDEATNYSPLIDVNRAVNIKAARVPFGVAATTTDLYSVFKGNVDDVNWGSEAVKINARDEGGVLIDTYIEEEIPYGIGFNEGPSPGTTDGYLQVVMQQLVDDSDNDATGDSPEVTYTRTGSYDPVTLLTRNDPNDALEGVVEFIINNYSQRREPVLGALRTLAGLPGFDCRYRYDPDPISPDWRLTLFAPERDQTHPNAWLDPGDMLDISPAKISAQNVRNIIRIKYLSAETTLPAASDPITFFGLPAGTISRQGWPNVDGKAQRQIAYYELEVGESVTRFGRRFMEIAEASSSQIDTIQEAQLMAVNIAKDLKDPDFEKTITVPLMPELELNDVLRFSPNELYSDDQQLAVRSITHNFTSNAVTTAQLRGKPAVGFKRWLGLETRPGVAAPGVYQPSQGNSAIPGSGPNTDVNKGNRLSMIREFMDETDYFSGSRFNNVRNNQFIQASAGRDNVPDGWRLDNSADSFSTSDATAEVGFDTAAANTFSGGQSLILRTGTVGSMTGFLVSDLVPFEPGTPFSAEITWLPTSTTPTATEPRVDIEFLEADQTTIAGTASLLVQRPTGHSLSPGFPFINGWIRTRTLSLTIAGGFNFNGSASAAESPSTTRYVRIKLKDQGAAAEDIWIDNISIYRAARRSPHLEAGAQIGPANNVFAAISWDTKLSDARDPLGIEIGSPFDTLPGTLITHRDGGRFVAHVQAEFDDNVDFAVQLEANIIGAPAQIKRGTLCNATQAGQPQPPGNARLLWVREAFYYEIFSGGGTLEIGFRNWFSSGGGPDLVSARMTIIEVPLTA
jgi:hypothetical protein